MIKRIFVGFVVMAGLLSVLPGTAMASFGFSSASVSAVEAPPGTPEHPGEAWSEYEERGVADLQAGSHPWAFRTSFLMNTTGPVGNETPDGDVKDVYVELPPGIVGNATVIPQCSTEQFETQFPVRHLAGTNYVYSGAGCPVNTQVGTADVEVRTQGEIEHHYLDVYNLVPPPGAPAQFGISPVGIPVILRPTVRSGGDYGLTVGSEDITQFLSIGGSTFTFWGTPGARSHDALRGECLGLEGETVQAVPHDARHGCSLEASTTPFLTMPTSCSAAAQPVTFIADSWQHPGRRNPDGTPDLSDPNWAQASAPLPAMHGCDRPPFGPQLSASADTSAADTPAGLTVEVTSGQDGLLNPTGIASAAIRETKVTLPAGFAINPGQAAGLAACQDAQDGLSSESPPSCPVGSRVGNVQFVTPLLRDPLEGHAYVLQSNPPNLKLLLEGSADGVNVKLLANVTLDEATGQVTTTLSNLPPLPVSDVKVSFSGGAQAALYTPATCGLYTTNSLFTPTIAPFAAALSSASSFAVTTGPGGSACASPLPFGPSITAGGSTDQAGAFTSFALLMERGDGQQRISGLQFKTPAGLLARVGAASLCPEPQASIGDCPAGSQIGHTVVAAGPGPYPLIVPEPGQPAAPIYLTSGYRGASYGLSIVVPVVAGPFDLGTKVVRASIAVDPHTAQLTITTDPSGPYAIPTILDGIPTDLRKIYAVIDHPGFMFNPTNCNSAGFAGTALSSEGASSSLFSRFRVGSCQSLAFKPTIKVSSSGKTSRRDGANLSVKVSYPPPPAGAAQATAESNIASLKLDLPRQLPARLTTLQKACLAGVFDANPAGCPAASLIGHATVHTPVLPVPLTGPVFFVSHGGEAFPNLVIVLQGYGVTVDVVGSTFISKAGILSSTFKGVPDAPFTSFEVTLPMGRYSALTANGNLCASKLLVPNAFNAQNGLVIHQATKIAVTGCPKAHNSKGKTGSTTVRAARSSNSDGRQQ